MRVMRIPEQDAQDLKTSGYKGQAYKKQHRQFWQPDLWQGLPGSRAAAGSDALTTYKAGLERPGLSESKRDGVGDKRRLRCGASSMPPCPCRCRSSSAPCRTGTSAAAATSGTAECVHTRSMQAMCRHSPLSCAELESPNAGRRGRPVRRASGAAEQHRRRRARARRGGELGGRHGGSAGGPPHPALRPVPGRARTRHLTLPQLGRRAGPEQRPCCAGRFSSRLSPRPAALWDPSRPEQSSCQRGSALPQQRRQRPCARGASPCSSLRLR